MAMMTIDQQGPQEYRSRRIDNDTFYDAKSSARLRCFFSVFSVMLAASISCFFDTGGRTTMVRVMKMSIAGPGTISATPVDQEQ